MTVASIAGNQTAKTWRICEGATMKVPVFRKRFYTYPNMSEWRWSSPGSVVWRVEGSDEAAGATIGYWAVNYDITFESRSNNINVLALDAHVLTIENASMNATPSEIVVEDEAVVTSSVPLKNEGPVSGILQSWSGGITRIAAGGHQLAKGTRLWIGPALKAFDDALDTMSALDTYAGTSYVGRLVGPLGPILVDGATDAYFALSSMRRLYASIA
jgi:hypothetical protein